MKSVLRTRYVNIPKGVTVRVSSRKVTVTGPRGSLVRDFKHFPCDMFMIGSKRVRVDLWFGNRNQASCVRTVCSHMENMITGVTSGYRYKMRFVYAHFPIQAAFPVTNQAGKTVPEGSVIEIRNFLGEHIVRRIKMLKGVTVTRSEGSNSSSEIILEGNCIEMVSQSGRCSLIPSQGLRLPALASPPTVFPPLFAPDRVSVGGAPRSLDSFLWLFFFCVCCVAFHGCARLLPHLVVVYMCALLLCPRSILTCVFPPPIYIYVCHSSLFCVVLFFRHL
jgi:large subunit ribosomal protein L9e